MRWSNSGTEEAVVEEDAAAEQFHGRHAGRGMHGGVMKSAESKPLMMMGTGTSFFFRTLFLHILSQAHILLSLL
jgi:hypothetical protein